MTGTHPFDDAVRLDQIDADVRRGRTHPEWENMVGPFGGITAAAVVRAVETHPDRIGEPLTLTINYAAPVADGVFDLSLRAVRTNRTNQHWNVELTQDGQVKATASAVFATVRDSWADTEAHPPKAPPPEPITPGALGDIVTWARLYDMRFVDGPIPTGQPSPSSTTTLWVRDKEQRPVDYPALAALCDVFYPRVFLRRGGMLPAGTITLTTYFLADRRQLDGVGSDYVLATAHANRFFGGYFDQSAQLWSRDGALLATSHQVVYFKG
ncbi:acyl-CoA thioesterase [Mycobacterium alsense]|uniref:Acyl-CoA thioesterase n=1 Tax=Mycobacterium alsense TaxID=324058 RepID=A0ABD6P583_9MYCO|nr:thioesterase family protein [Mycobacterium alsense]OBG39255.1 acyl-CoA thioesterase [Mycobacterium alsense]OBI98742.1 acyl-CoA thioesterase [Mycobacterium alsense]